MKQVDILIVGGGPAGLTAGIYAARAGMTSVVLESGFAGGQASTTDRIENYPGFPEGVGGMELMMAFEQQYSRYDGSEVCYDGVQSLNLAEKTATTLSGETISAKAMILAMGAEPRKLGVPGEAELTGNGVSYCATCDGMFFRGKTVAIVGGGDTAVEDAVYMKQLATVKLIHRRDELRAASRAGDALMTDPEVEKFLSHTVEKIEKRDGRLLLTMHDRKADGDRQLEVDGLFVAVGTQPRTELIRGQLALDGAGYVLAGEDTRTEIPGVFAAGDLRARPLKQVITAAADGAVAASMAIRHVLERQ
ncbi:MAG: FAD-dependent oxidoreductase [Clostridia bacterium]|nr:FAD-dependent oxidoreductase [Clostridia bacterium]